MHTLRPAIVLATALLVTAAGCSSGGGNDSPTAPPMPPTQPPSTFAQFQAQIFTPSCAFAGCHDAATAQSGLVLEAGLSHGNLVGVPSVQRPDLSLVEPGQPEQSYLIKKLRGDGDIVGDRMPRNAAALAQADIDALIAWINDGAPNN